MEINSVGRTLYIGKSVSRNDAWRYMRLNIRMLQDQGIEAISFSDASKKRKTKKQTLPVSLTSAPCEFFSEATKDGKGKCFYRLKTGDLSVGYPRLKMDGQRACNDQRCPVTHRIFCEGFQSMTEVSSYGHCEKCGLEFTTAQTYDDQQSMLVKVGVCPVCRSERLKNE